MFSYESLLTCTNYCIVYRITHILVLLIHFLIALFNGIVQRGVGGGRGAREVALIRDGLLQCHRLGDEHGHATHVSHFGRPGGWLLGRVMITKELPN